MIHFGVGLLIALLGSCAVTDSQSPDAAPDAASIDSAIAIDAVPTPDATAVSELDRLLQALRNNTAQALQEQSAAGGWPAPVEDGYLFVTTAPNLDMVAGEHDNWEGTDLQLDDGFRWIVLNVLPGNRYKFTNLTDWLADPWSRAYEWDQFGEMSMVPPTDAHLERFFEVGAGSIEPRTVRVWVPAQPVTHVLYVQDGQNLFNPNAFFGGWRLDQSAPPEMLIVGIDNAAARMDEYTHVTDEIGGNTVGGLGDEYAEYVENTVRELVRTHYGEPELVGVMGSSLGGLISFHIADRYPMSYDFAASLSGTMGWGSIGAGVQNETMLDRYMSAGHRNTVLYLDSGGNGPCEDSDGDGMMDDDPNAADNYCENIQFRDLLYGLGYTDGVDIWHWWESGAPHNEAAWADRVWRPLGVFADIQ